MTCLLSSAPAALRRRWRPFGLLALLLSLLGWSRLGVANLTIEITSGVDNPIKVAIVPFRGAEGVDDVAGIVSGDLERTGQFSAIARNNMLSTPHEEQEVVMRDWRLLGADYVAIGQLQRTANGQSEVRYLLFNTATGARLLAEMLTGRSDQTRALAHRVSDRIYEAITGIPGIFSTQMIYITESRSAGAMRYRLFLADADGERPQVLLDSREPILSPAWAPDGERIAYVSFETGRPAIYVQNVRSGQREQVTNFSGLNSAPDWSPDGRRLALVLSKDGDPEIYILDLATRNLKRVTSHFAIDTEPRWLPDGESLIFTSNRGGKPQIYQLDLDSLAVKRVTYEGDYNARGTVTADGRTLVFVHRSGGNFHIAAQDLKRGNVRILSDTRLDESPSVSPNGTMVLYATETRGQGILAAVSIDGRVRFRIPATEGDVREPAWSPLR